MLIRSHNYYAVFVLIRCVDGFAICFPVEKFTLWEQDDFEYCLWTLNMAGVCSCACTPTQYIVITARF